MLRRISAEAPKTQLALAIAQGMPITKWAKNNNVPRRTAFRWATEPKVRAMVESCRRRALDRAIGQMSAHASPGRPRASSSSPRMPHRSRSSWPRLRAVLSDMMAVSEVRGPGRSHDSDSRSRLHDRDWKHGSRGLRPCAARPRPSVTDRSPWDWYAESCPCGLPPGRVPRASPRPAEPAPPAGDWRVWAYVAGRGAGKTRAGASLDPAAGSTTAP